MSKHLIWPNDCIHIKYVESAEMLPNKHTRDGYTIKHVPLNLPLLDHFSQKASGKNFVGAGFPSLVHVQSVGEGIP